MSEFSVLSKDRRDVIRKFNLQCHLAINIPSADISHQTPSYLHQLFKILMSDLNKAVMAEFASERLARYVS